MIKGPTRLQDTVVKCLFASLALLRKTTAWFGYRWKLHIETFTQTVWFSCSSCNREVHAQIEQAKILRNTWTKSLWNGWRRCAKHWFNDFIDQLDQVQNINRWKTLLKMIPGIHNPAFKTWRWWIRLLVNAYCVSDDTWRAWNLDLLSKPSLSYCWFWKYIHQRQ